MANLNLNNYFLKFIFYFFKLSGLATFELIEIRLNKGQLSRWVAKKSKMGILYNMFLALITIISSFIGINYMIKTNYLGRLPNEFTVVAMADIFFVFTTVLTLTTFSFQQEKIVSIIGKISDGMELSLVLNETKYSTNNCSIFIRIILCIINTILMLGLLIVATEFDVRIFFYGVSMFTWLLVNSGVFFGYSIILELIRSLLKLINDSFHDILKPINNGVGGIWDREVKLPIKI